MAGLARLVPECDAGSYSGAVFSSWPKLASSVVSVQQELLMVLPGQNKRRLHGESSVRGLASPARLVCCTRAMRIRLGLAVYTRDELSYPSRPSGDVRLGGCGLRLAEAVGVRWSSGPSRPAPAIVVWLGCHGLGTCQIVHGTEYSVMCSLHPLLPLASPRPGTVSSQTGTGIWSSHNVTLFLAHSPW